MNNTQADTCVMYHNDKCLGLDKVYCKKEHCSFWKSKEEYYVNLETRYIEKYGEIKK